MPKNAPFLRVFIKREAGGQTVPTDRLILIGQKWVEDASIQKFQCDILSHFQTMCELIRLFFLSFIIIVLIIIITRTEGPTNYKSPRYSQSSDDEGKSQIDFGLPSESKVFHSFFFYPPLCLALKRVKYCVSLSCTPTHNNGR